MTDCQLVPSTAHHARHSAGQVPVEVMVALEMEEVENI